MVDVKIQDQENGLLGQFVLFAICLLLPLASSAQFHDDFERPTLFEGGPAWQGFTADGVSGSFQIWGGRLGSIINGSRGQRLGGLSLHAPTSEKTHKKAWMFKSRLNFTVSNSLRKTNFAQVVLCGDKANPLMLQSGVLLHLEHDKAWLEHRENGQILRQSASIAYNPEAWQSWEVAFSPPSSWLLYNGEDSLHFEAPFPKQADYFGLVAAASSNAREQSFWFDDLQLQLFPYVEQAHVVGDRQLELVFSAPLSENLQDLKFELDGAMLPTGISVAQDTLKLEFAEHFPLNMPLNMRIWGISDVWGNRIPARRPEQVGFTYTLPDVYPPQVDSVRGWEGNTLEVWLDEEVPLPCDTCFWLKGTAIKASGTVPITEKHWHIRFPQVFEKGEVYRLAYSQLTDMLGNTLQDTLIHPFTFYDHRPPDATGIALLPPNGVAVHFSEAIANQQQDLQVLLYKVENSAATGRQPVHVQRAAQNAHTLQLWFAQPFPENSPLKLTVHKVADLSGNQMPQTFTFNFERDTRRPRIATSGSVVPLSARVLRLGFSEAMDSALAVIPNHYWIDGGVGHPDSIGWEGEDIRLFLDTALVQEQEYKLEITGLTDLVGNPLGNRTRRFTFDTRPPMLMAHRFVPPKALQLTFSEPIAEPLLAAAFFEVAGRPPSAVGYNPAAPERLSLTWADTLPRVAGAVLRYASIPDLLHNRLTDTLVWALDLHRQQLGQAFVAADRSLILAFTQPFFADSLPTVAQFGLLNEEGEVTKPKQVLLTPTDSFPYRYTLEWESPFPEQKLISLKINGMDTADATRQLTAQIKWAFPFSGVAGIDSRQVVLAVAQPLQQAVATQAQFYRLGTNTFPKQVLYLAEEAQLQLHFDAPFPADSVLQLTIQPLHAANGDPLPMQAIPFQWDTRAPKVQHLSIPTNSHLQLTFNEHLWVGAAQAFNHYTLQGIESPWSQIELLGDTLVMLELAQPLAHGGSYALRIDGVQDLARNTLNDTVINFSVPHPPRYGEVLITEIMFDPTPAVGLPEAEYLELFNAGDKQIDLASLQLSVGGDALQLPSYVLASGAFVTLTGWSGASEFADSLPVLGMSGFPALPNSGALVQLLNMEGQEVGSVDYAPQWLAVPYREGGYALEMLDLESPCVEVGNWAASRHAAGGTPGTVNSQQQQLSDHQPPALEGFSVQDSLHIALQFDERTPLRLQDGLQFMLEGAALVANWQCSDCRAGKWQVILSTPLQKGKAYRLSWLGLSDCSGNLAQGETHIRMPEQGAVGDLKLSEVLFDPPMGSVDFVEIFNASSKYLDLTAWQLHGRDTAEKQPLSTGQSLIAPGQYCVLTSNVQALKSEYPQLADSSIVVHPLPSMPNDAGAIGLVAPSGIVAEHYHYHEDHHHPMIDDTEGVSLERISFAQPSELAQNWHSAASTVGYATPGQANSQARNGKALRQECVVVVPQAISPNQDGHNDFAHIRFGCDYGGQMMSTFLYNQAGFKVRELAKSSVMPTTGELLFDGTDDQGRPLPTGYYLLLIELFDLDGNVQVIKKAIAISSD